jgi:hypothetical protein
MRSVLVVAVVVSAQVAHAEPCKLDPKPGAVLVKARGKVDVLQSCAGGYVAFTWSKDDRKTAEVARCDAATCTVLARWQGLQNCDDGMCDHFSSVDHLSIAGIADVDADGTPDVFLDFGTTHGDQGKQDHRLKFWLSKKKKVQEVGQIDSAIDEVSDIPGGVAVTLHDGFVDEPVSRTTRCYSPLRAMKCPAARR